MGHIDVQRGHLCVKRYGLRYDYYHDYKDEQDFLSSKYGVHLDVVAGCCVTTSLAAYVKGYNSVAVPAIRKKFGKDVFEEYWQERRRSFLPLLVEQIRHVDVERRKRAAKALVYDAAESKYGSEFADFIPDIVTALEDEDIKVREYVARSLGHIGTTATPAIPALRRLLHDTHAEVREAAVAALAQIEVP